MAQDAITRAESDADEARQEATSPGTDYPGRDAFQKERDEFLKEMRRMQQRMLFVAILATGLIIGAMQVS